MADPIQPFRCSPPPPHLTDRQRLNISLIALSVLTIGGLSTLFDHCEDGANVLAVGDLLTGGTLACGLLDVVVSVFSRCIWGEPGERRSREVDGVITALAVYGLVVAGLRTEEAWSDRGCDDDLGNRFFDVGGMCGALLVIARYICGQTERVAPDAPPPPIQAWPAPVAPAANPPAPQPLQAVLVADPEASLPGSPNGSSAERSALESLPGSRED